VAVLANVGERLLNDSVRRKFDDGRSPVEIGGDSRGDPKSGFAMIVKECGKRFEIRLGTRDVEIEIRSAGGLVGAKEAEETVKISDRVAACSFDGFQRPRAFP
jgi:hypothetical protein